MPDYSDCTDHFLDEYENILLKELLFIHNQLHSIKQEKEKRDNEDNPYRTGLDPQTWRRLYGKGDGINIPCQGETY